MGKYDSSKHEEAIRERHRREQASADHIIGSAQASADNETQIRYRLDEIMDELEGINDELHTVKETMNRPADAGPAPRPGSLEHALTHGLARAAKLPRLDAEPSAREAAEKIREFLRDNDSRTSEAEVTDAVRKASEDGEDAKSYADAVHRKVAEAALEPGRNLPHDMSALDEAHRILSDVHKTIRDAQSGGGGKKGTKDAPQPTITTPPPGAASSEIIRDVSHLTALLLGSSPAFAEAMRVQSDAIAYSLAALNKVGDMQRQDALGLAITANAAATQFDRR